MCRWASLALLLLASCDKAIPPPAPPPASPAQAPSPPPTADQNEIAFIRKGDVWLMSAGHPEAARRLTHLENGQAAEPTWSPDRSWIAFTAAGQPDRELYSRNVFLVRPDGSGLKQVTPMPRAGRSLEEGPQVPIQGRALLMVDGVRRSAAGLRLSVYGTRRTWETRPDGTFQAFVPAGGGWIKLSGTANDRRVTLWRFLSASEGKLIDLGDLNVPYGGDESLAAPAFSPDGRRISYLVRHSLINRLDLEGPVSLKAIGTDGDHDETLFTPPRCAIIAGPALQGGRPWIKTSDGRISSVDPNTHRLGESLEAGVGVPDALAAGPGGDWATLSLDPAGRLTLVHLKGTSKEVLWVFESGEPCPHALSFSPDGTRLVLDGWKDGQSDLWILDLGRRTLDRLTTGGESSHPVWYGR